MTLLLAATPKSKADLGAADYQPGACNIGPAEIARRWRAGHLGVVATLATLGIVLVVGAPPLARLIVALPAAGAAVAYLEAALKFCVAFGSRGAFNFGALGTLATVADPSARSRDRRRALEISLAGALIGLAVGAIAVALPI
jgi:hypothetical protein